MRRSRPYSLTFLVSPSEADLLRTAYPVEKTASPEHFTETWFDTPRHDLRGAGLSLSIFSAHGHRWRRARRWPAEHAADEWPDLEIEADFPDFETLPNAFADALGEETIHGEPVFVAGVDRTRLSTPAASRGVDIAMCVDRIALTASDATMDIIEARMSLVAGRAGDIFAAARALPASMLARIDFAAGAERGYRLRDGLSDKAAGKTPSTIHRRMNAMEAFTTIARGCLRQYSLNSQAFGGADENEAVHQTRIAIRRLRSAMTLFAPILRDTGFDRLRAELKWLFGCLGEARDLDVHVEFLQARAGTADGANDGLAGLEERRRAAHENLKTALASERVGALLLDIAEWTETGAWRRSIDAKQARYRGLSVGDFVARRLTKRRQSLVKLSSDVETLGEKDAHVLRIETKKLRYMIEFLEPLARRGKALDRYKKDLKTLSRLQETLGLVHDLDERAARAQPVDDPSTQLENAARPEPETRANLLERASKHARSVIRAKPFWKLI